MEVITAAEFDNKLKSAEYVLIDFSSPGCAPCKKVPPMLAEIIAAAAGKNIAAYEVNIVDEMTIAQKHFVLGVPTIIIFKNGKEIQRFNSLPPKEKILNAIK
ncbi:MAG: thioredoxin family protein [Candidatus Aminicenantes bacterium]|nr:thioredoxin family protein [Candidatus Aminicenantes bacterium]